MNNNVSNVLCDQVINIALVLKEVTETPVNVFSNAANLVAKFETRINSVLNFVQKLFVDYESNKVDEVFVNDKMCELLYTLTKYKNSYAFGGIAYNTMNSLLDIATETFVELNNK